MRCVPPENKPEPAEIKACRRFLAAEIAAMPKLAAILALGDDRAPGACWRRSACAAPPTLRAMARCTRCRAALLLADSYHCSRYNTNTGRLTPAMFEAVFAALRDRLSGSARA